MQGSSIYWLLGLGAISAFLMLRAHRQLRRTTISPTPIRTSHNRSPLNIKPVEAQRWEVEMHETMRAWSAQLDTKLGVLQQTIRVAEQVAARLEFAIAEARYLDADRPRPTSPNAKAVVPPAASQADHLRASLKPEAPSRAGSPPANDSRAGDRPIERIHALADAGHDAAAIARQVGSPIGEVELILGLRRNSPG